MENTVIEGQANGTVAETTQERTFTQAELDEIVKSRIAKERAKYGDYETLQAKASKFDEMEEANKSELQKATEKAQALQKQLDDLNRATEIRNIHDKVSSETGVPSSLLTAETEEECKAQAEAIKSFAQSNVSYPSVRDGGEVQNIQHKTTESQFEDWLNASLKK